VYIIKSSCLPAVLSSLSCWTFLVESGFYIKNTCFYVKSIICILQIGQNKLEIPSQEPFSYFHIILYILSSTNNTYKTIINVTRNREYIAHNLFFILI